MQTGIITLALEKKAIFSPKLAKIAESSHIAGQIKPFLPHIDFEIVYRRRSEESSGLPVCGFPVFQHTHSEAQSQHFRHGTHFNRTSNY
jgi:hypothetical protein